MALVEARERVLLSEGSVVKVVGETDVACEANGEACNEALEDIGSRK